MRHNPVFNNSRIVAAKNVLTLRDAIQHLNMVWPRSKKLSCPYHVDKTPSLHLYEKTNSWTCFSCGATGDAYGLVAAYTGTPVETVLKQYAAKGPTFRAPKPNPTAIRKRIRITFLAHTQRMFLAIRNSDLDDWQKDLLLLEAAELADKWKAGLDEQPLSDAVEAVQKKVPALVDAFLEARKLSSV